MRMTAMGPWLILLAVYVTLDVANPLMPGAVQFEAGAVQSVQAACPARPRLPAVPAIRSVESLRIAAVLPAVPAVRSAPVRPVPPPGARAMRRRVAPSALDAPPSLSEDH